MSKNSTPDLTGRRFGKLAARYRSDIQGKSGRKYIAWFCDCDCTNNKVVQSSNLILGITRSCGCLRVAGNNLKHGNARHGKRSPEYASWVTMMQRCTNPNHEHAAYYVNAGVVVCDRWKTFENFLSDMGPKPTRKHTLGRFEDDGPYDQFNCAWQTPAEQGLEKRKKNAIRKTAPVVKSKTVK